MSVGKNLNPAKKTEINDTFELLENGKKRIEISEDYKDICLILGNTGSGKSTFIQWMMGDNEKLKSVKVGEDDSKDSEEDAEEDAEYIIEDGNRISSSVKSKTIFPERVIDAESNTAFYDCPGFSDTRSASYDIATTYFTKQLTDHAEKIKLILVINYPSVTKGADRLDFVRLIRHATEFVKNVEKYKNSIALVVTKVNPKIKSKTIVKNIGNYLLECKQSMEEDLADPEISQSKKSYLHSAMKLIDILLTKNNGEYSRIGLFRKPNKPGPLNEIVLLQNGKKSIRKILFESLESTIKSDNDFGYTVSDQSKNVIFLLVDKINNNILHESKLITDKLHISITNLTNQSLRKIYSFVDGDLFFIDASKFEAHQLNYNMKNGMRAVTNLMKNIRNLTHKSKLEFIMRETLTELKVDSCEKSVMNISVQVSYLEFLNNVNAEEIKLSGLGDLFKTLEEKCLILIMNIQKNIDNVAEKLETLTLKELEDIAIELEKWYLETSEVLEVENLSSHVSFGFLTLTKWKRQSTGLSPLEMFEVVDDCVTELKTKNSKIKNSLYKISNYVKYYEFLNILSNRILKIDQSNMVEPVISVLNFLDDSIKWYHFLDNLSDSLKSYSVQGKIQRVNVGYTKSMSKLQNMIVTKKSLPDFLSILNYQNNKNNSIESIQITENHLKKLNNLLSLKINSPLKFDCSVPGVLTIKGNYIKFSDFINDERTLPDLCMNGIRINALNIFALESVFLDESFSAVGKKLQLTIVAPKIEVVGSIQIVLDGLPGANQSVASNGRCAGCRGDDGRPGNPGSPSGNFLSICDEFTNIEALTVSLNGGRGGNGQNGGNGIEGSKGERGSDNCKTSDELILILGNAAQKVCPGKLGQTGGNGGHGGQAGLGGHSGDFLIVIMGKNHNLPFVENSSLSGYPGYGGVGGLGGLKGDSRVYIRNNHWFTVWIPYESHERFIAVYERSASGSNGLYGYNSSGRKTSEEKVSFQNIVTISSSYKNYLRENLENNVLRHSLKNFHLKLSSNSVINDHYNTIARITEITDLEKQSQTLLNVDKDMLISFYKSILNQTVEYATRLTSSSANHTQDMYVLKYIYTAVLSKISGFKDNSEPNLITDVDKYLEVIGSDINNLKSSQQKVQVINQSNNFYKSGIDSKIFQADDFIKKTIMPEIESIKNQIYSKIDLLVDEVTIFKKQAVNQRDKLLKKKKELENALFLSRLMDAINISAKVLSVFSGTGAIVASFSDSIIQIAKPFILENERSKIETLKVPEGLVSDLKGIKQSFLDSEPNTDKQLELTAKSALQFGKIAVDVYNKYKNDQKKVETIDDAIKQARQNIANFENYQSIIHSDIIPILQNMQNSLNVVSSRLENRTQVYLDVTKWKVKSGLEDMRLQMKKFMKGFEIEDDFARCIEKLDEALTILIDLYGRIQEYQDKKQLSDYIANIASADGNHIDILDPKLRETVLYFEKQINSNLVMEKYKIAISALKQHVFPLAHFYLNEIALPSVLEKENDFQSLVSTAMSQVDAITLKIKDYKTSINQHDGHLMQGCFNSDYKSTKPFFVWESLHYADSISKLLSGQKVALKADIVKSDSDKNAIKFNEIGLTFTSLDVKLNVELNDSLKGFIINATHLGNSLFKFREDVYLINSDSQNIVFSLEKDKNGDPIYKNNVYSKLKSGNLMLSPYAMWEIQLINNENHTAFEKLKKYKDIVNVELVGCGRYLMRDSNINKFEIDKYYENEYDVRFAMNNDGQSRAFIDDETPGSNMEFNTKKLNRRRRRDLPESEPISHFASGASQNKPWTSALYSKFTTILGEMNVGWSGLFDFSQKSSMFLKPKHLGTETPTFQNIQQTSEFTVSQLHGGLQLMNLLVRKITKKRFESNLECNNDKFSESEARLLAGVQQWEGKQCCDH